MRNWKTLEYIINQFKINNVIIVAFALLISAIQRLESTKGSKSKAEKKYLLPRLQQQWTHRSKYCNKPSSPALT